MNPSGEKVAKISQNNERFYWCSDGNFSLDFQKKQTVNKCQSSMGTHNNENYLYIVEEKLINPIVGMAKLSGKRS